MKKPKWLGFLAALLIVCLVGLSLRPFIPDQRRTAVQEQHMALEQKRSRGAVELEQEGSGSGSRRTGDEHTSAELDLKEKGQDGRLPAKRAKGTPSLTTHHIAKAEMRWMLQNVMKQQQEDISKEETLALIREQCRRKQTAYYPESVARDKYGTQLVPKLRRVTTRKKEEEDKGKEESVEYLTIQQKPSSSNSDPWGKGIFLFFHGCSHTAKDFCFASATTNCPRCRGLPEEIAFAVEVLRRGWSVIAITARNKHSHCWGTHRFVKNAADATGSGEDVPVGATLLINNLDVLNVLHVLEEEKVLGRTAAGGDGIEETIYPLMAMGASSGGSFVGLLPEAIGPQLQVIVPQIAAPSVHREGQEHLAVAYSVMSRDKHTVSTAQNALKRFSRDEKQGKVFVSVPQVLSADYFETHIGVGSGDSTLTPPMTEQLSELIVKALARSRMLASESNSPRERHGQLLKDPRHSLWRKVIRSVLEEAAQNATQAEDKRQRSERRKQKEENHEQDGEEKAEAEVDSEAKTTTPRQYNLEYDSLAADKSPIAEVMNVAYGYHEFTAEYAVDILDFGWEWLHRRLV